MSKIGVSEVPWQKVSDYARRMGFDHAAGAINPGVTVIPHRVVLSGASHAFTIQDADGESVLMADSDYVVQITSENTSVTIDESTKTASGFTIIGGSASDVAYVTITGRVDGQL